MPISLPASVVYIQYRINSPLSRKLHFLHTHVHCIKYWESSKYAMSSGHFQCLQKFNRVHIWVIYNTIQEGKCRDSRELIGCYRLTNNAGKEDGMTKFKC